MKFAMLAIGSLAGGFSRYALAGWIGRPPWGTLAVNVAGCFVIGILNAIADQRAPLSPELRILLVTGFCGAFTTFSSLILESSLLFKGGQGAAALLNLAGSVVLGCLAFWAGEWLVRLV